MGKRLIAGERAPAFSVTDLEGRRVAPVARGRLLLLSFYRYASCPLCNLRVHDLAQRHRPWQVRGLDMLGVFQSPAEKLRQYVAQQAPPFPLVPDPDEALYRLYGVEARWRGLLSAAVRRLPAAGRAMFRQGFLPGSVEGGIHRLPADFLIGPDARIVATHYGRDIGDHLPFEHIEAYLEKATS